MPNVIPQTGRATIFESKQGFVLTEGDFLGELTYRVK